MIRPLCYADPSQPYCKKTAHWRNHEALLQCCGSPECFARLAQSYSPRFGKLEWVKITSWQYFRWWIGDKLAWMSGLAYGPFWIGKRKKKNVAA